MKKYFTIFLAAAMALSLCACDKADNYSNSNVESGSEVSSSSLISPPASSLTSGESATGVSAEQSAPAGVDNAPDITREKKLTLLFSGHNIFSTGCGTDEGYYDKKRLGPDDPYVHFTYVDYASGQEVILCSDSSCKHDTERCTSIVPAASEPRFNPLFFYKERLYYLATGLDNEGSISAPATGGTTGDEYTYSNNFGITPELYAMNPDGTGRELVYRFGENDVVEDFAVGDGDCLWFITKEPTVERDEKTGATRRGSKNRAMVRLDLNERKIVEQIPISYADNINKDFIGVCGDKCIFGGIAYPGGKSEMDYIDILAPSPTFGDLSGMDEYLEFMSTCEYAFFALNVTDKTMTEIYRTGFDDISLDYTQVGDRLYIPTGENFTSAFSLDLNTGVTEEFPVPEGYTLDGFVGERPLYITTDGEYKRYFRDPDTGEMKDSVLEYSISSVLAVNGDSALVIYKMEGEVQPDGGIRNPRYLYALITLDDLYNGRDNFKPIDMLEGS